MTTEIDFLNKYLPCHIKMEKVEGISAYLKETSDRFVQGDKVSRRSLQSKGGIERPHTAYPFIPREIQSIRHIVSQGFPTSSTKERNRIIDVALCCEIHRLLTQVKNGEFAKGEMRGVRRRVNVLRYRIGRNNYPYVLG